MQWRTDAQHSAISLPWKKSFEQVEQVVQLCVSLTPNQQQRITMDDSQFESIGDKAADQFATLCMFIEHKGIEHGTSATVGVSDVEIKGVKYQLQLRMEMDPASFIGDTGVVQTRKFGALKNNN